ncbi:MAG TPA: flagellar hook capping FlgD N-terminal domain-containing protein [Terracidiphilus sp.]|jgi:flagellar basal-body rod modification protein FlgD|nr:flagellar hook capping FlgD N-terminal domain-containing protein [Terracidiphilus sp.]
MATASLFSHHAAASISLASAHAAATPAVSSSPSTSSGATISANDFLTLLVTEMQNQDPTATTDPNEYINQLVNVNSLEQLIQINQTLSSATTPAAIGAQPGGESTSGTSTLMRGTNQANAYAPSAPAPPASGSPQRSPHADLSTPVTAGNLGVPAASPASLGVAQAMGVHRRLR